MGCLTLTKWDQKSLPDRTNNTLDIVGVQENKKSRSLEFPLWLNGLRKQLVSRRMWVWSLALLSGLRFLGCCLLRHYVAHAARILPRYGCGIGQQLHFDPLPGNFHRQQVQTFKKKKKVLVICPPQRNDGRRRKEMVDKHRFTGVTVSLGPNLDY